MTKPTFGAAWTDRLVIGLLTAVGIILFWYGDILSLKSQILLWAGLAATVALVATQGWVNLFGPVLFYDLVRTGRRSRYILFRFIYALILFAVLVQMHINLNIERSWRRTQESTSARLARLGDQYFATFMTMQVIAVLLLTPAYTAGAIAEEKDRKTLPFVLATDLEDREIVLSKLVSRLCSLTFILLVSLPIMALMQFLGGIDPEMVLASYLATGLTMASLASLSILASVYARKTRDALGRVYMGMVAYLALLPLVELMLRFVVPAAGAVPLWFGESPPTLFDLVDTINHGNIFMAYFSLAMAVSSGRSLGAALESVLADYMTFHVICTAACTTWAVLRLRAVALQQAGGAVGVREKKLAKRALRLRRPPVSNRPMLWKEVYVEAGSRLNALGRILVGVLVVASFVPAGWIIYDYFTDATWLRRLGPPGSSPFQIAINMWVRITGTVVACLLWLAIAVRASGAVTGERDRDTMDSLLTSPLGSAEMFFAKWWGSICSVRWGLLWLGLIWTTGAILGGVHVMALPPVAGAWFVIAALFASLGMWFTCWCKTTGRATLTTMIVALFCGGLHWFVLGLCCYMPLAWSAPRGGGDAFKELVQFHACGLTPPVTLGLLAFNGAEFSNTHDRNDFIRFTIYAVIGLSGWVVLALIVYVAAQERFRILSRRFRSEWPSYPGPIALPEQLARE